MSIVSATRRFIEWLQTTVSRLIGVAGSITVRRQQGKNPMWLLRYAKAQSLRLLAWMYYTPNVPCLERKRITAERFLSPLGHAAGRPTGRPRVGWIYDAPRVEEGRSSMVSFGSQHTYLKGGGVSELEYDPGSNPGARKGLGVQIPSPPPFTFLDRIVARPVP